MVKSVSIFNAGREVDITVSRFPGGEMHVHIGDFNDSSAPARVTANLRSSDDIMTLMLLMDALKRKHHCGDVNLSIPYLPYARQDRVCKPGEALSLRVICNIINSFQHDRLEVWDVHSDVAMSLLDERAYNVPSYRIIERFIGRKTFDPANTILVAPDAGALKKVTEVSKNFGMPVVRADKTRMPDGSIGDTKVYTDWVDDKDFLIVDDICDGGRTFISLAKKLQLKGCGKIYLYVTHGIFSAGVDVFDGLIDKVFTANSFVGEHPKLVTF